MSTSAVTVDCSSDSENVLFSTCDGRARMIATRRLRVEKYPLSTAHLRFRPWKDTDLALAISLWGDDKVTALIGGPFDTASIEVRLTSEIKREATDGVQYWPMFLHTTKLHDISEDVCAESHAFVGCCGLRPYVGSAGVVTYELGFHLRPQFWGQGFATEAANAALSHAFGQLAAQVVVAGHNPNNVASAALIQKLGFSQVRKEFYEPTGLMHPTYELHRSAQVAAKFHECLGGVLDIESTYVPSELRGRSIASKLAEAALAYAATHRMCVKPSCEFIGTFIAKNRRYAAIVEKTTESLPVCQEMEPDQKRLCTEQNVG